MCNTADKPANQPTNKQTIQKLSRFKLTMYLASELLLHFLVVVDIVMF